MNLPRACRSSKSNSNASFMPASLAAPQPKQRLVSFGSSLRICPIFFVRIFAFRFRSRPLTLPALATGSAKSSHQSHMCSLGAPGTTQPLAHFNAKKIGNHGHAAPNLLFIQVREPEAQRIRERRLHVEIAPRRKQDAALARMNHQFGCVESGRQLQPHAHAAPRTIPADSFGHGFAQSLIERVQAIGIDPAHAYKMLLEQTALEKFSKRGLRKLAGVKIGHLLNDTEALNRRSRRNDPADAKARKSNLGEAV